MEESGADYGKERSITIDDWADSGIVVSQKAISLDPNLAEAYKALGLCYGGKGFVNRALDSYYKAVEKNPNYTPAVGNISILNAERGNYSEAFRWAIKDAKLTSSEPFVYLERGGIYLSLADDQRAKEWFQKALDLQPDFIYPYLALANIFVEGGDLVKATEYVEKSLTIEPHNLSALNNLGNIKLSEGNFASAKEYFEKAQTQSLKLIDFAFRGNTTGIGFALLRMGRRSEGMKFLDEVQAYYEREVGRGNEYFHIRYELATISAVKAKPAEACEWLQKAVDAGFRNYRYTQRDPMMEGMRSDPKFLEIISQMKDKVEEQRKLVGEADKE